MTDEPRNRDRPGRSRSAWLRRAGYAFAILFGFSLALLLLISPPGRALLGQLTHLIPGSWGGDGAESVAGSESRLWTCGMHPNVIEEHPGQCPICRMNLVPMRGGVEAGGTVPGERRVLFYRNPMNPTVTSPVPMKDEMGMDYVPVYEDSIDPSGADGSVVAIDPSIVQNMGVLTTPVTRRDLKRSIRTVGYLDYDQERMVTITTKYGGFVEKVYVNYLGQSVRKGEPLFEIYSPQLVQTEQELLSARNFAERMKDAPPEARRQAESLVDAAKTRLSYWDITPEQIARLEKTGQVFRTLPVLAPISGLVMKRSHGLEGMAVQPGVDVLHIADISSLWLNVEVFVDELPWLKPDSTATVTLTNLPGERFTGRIRYIEPEVSEKTRSLKVTIEVPNNEGRLRSGMYTTVEFAPVIARDAIVVPSYAVLRTGTRDIVVVALGEGRFQPREITLGPEGEGWVQVLSGLEEGMEVVTSSQFLIDSESNLREAVNRMISGREAGD